MNAEQTVKYLEGYYYPYPEIVRRIVMKFLEESYRGKSEDWKKNLLWEVLKIHPRASGHAPDVAVLERAMQRMREQRPLPEYKALPIVRISEEEAARYFEKLRQELWRKAN